MGKRLQTQGIGQTSSGIDGDDQGATAQRSSSDAQSRRRRCLPHATRADADDDALLLHEPADVVSSIARGAHSRPPNICATACRC